MRFIVSEWYLRVRGVLVFHFEMSPVVALDLGDVLSVWAVSCGCFNDCSIWFLWYLLPVGTDRNGFD